MNGKHWEIVLITWQRPVDCSMMENNAILIHTGHDNQYL